MTEPATTPERRREVRRVMASSYLGTTIEFYDFLLYGTAAAVVFNRLFFTDLDPLAGTLASFGTLAVGYVARPLGGIVFGHFGDRLGRKSMLVTTMTIMGLASFLIGLLPTYEQIGVWAPLLLVALRVIQGVAVGGEWGGAALMTLEHADKHRRGFAASFTNMGGPSGAVLATAVFGLFSLLPEDAFLAWGWRIPFLLSALLVAVGLYVRLSISESPLFREAVAARDATAPAQEPPLVHVLRTGWRNVGLAAFGGTAAFLLQSLLATFVISYAISQGQPRSTVLLMFTLASVVHIFTIPAFAALSDRIGRRPVMIGGAVLGVLVAWPIMALIADGSPWLLLLGFLLGNPLVQAAMYGPMAAFMSEMFGTAARYTGASLGYQLATMIGGGFGPLIASMLLAAGGGTDVTPVAVLLAATCLLSAGAVALTRETHRADLSDDAPRSLSRATRA